MKQIPRILAATAILALGALAWSQESPSDEVPPDQTAAAENDLETDGELSQLDAPPGEDRTGAAKQERPAAARRQDVIASLTIFVLAVFVGFEVITKVPPTLHTPLMSGSNAISGITLVGAVIVASGSNVSSFVGMVAVILATVNAVGGFLVTHRMLAMFQRR